MPRALGNRRYRSVVRAVMATPWAVMPEKIDAMAEILTLRASGLAFTPEEVRLRLGAYDPEGDEENDDPRGPKLVGDVMVLRLYGMLFPRANMITEYSGGTSTGKFSADFKAALADQRCRSILIDIDSPGGAVTGTDECARVVYEGRGQGKPIYGLANGLCTSAAYYIGSGCDRLYATSSSALGSIGVLRIHEEISKETPLTGRTYTVLKAGRYKAAGNPYEPLSKDSRAAMEELLGDAYTMFVDAVARHRKVSTQTVLAQFGEGKVMLAGRALEAGLIDGLTTFDELRAQMQSGAVTAAATRPSDETVPLKPTAIPEPENRSPSVPLPSSVPPSPQEKVMDKRIIAALYAVGALASMDADEATCKAVLGSFFAAHGQTAPAETKDCLAAISRLHGSAGAANTIATVAAQLQPVAPVTTAPAAVNEADVRKSERARIADLEARAELLGISETDLQAAIDSGEAPEKAVDRWTTAKVKEGAPISKQITPLAASADTICSAATEVLMSRIDFGSIENAKKSAGEKVERKPLSAEAKALQYASMLDIARTLLQAKGERLSAMAPEQIAARFLALGGSDNNAHALMAEPYGAPADFPSVLSALSGKLLLKAHEIAEVTYPDYCFTMPSVNDFKPKTLHATGYFGLMSRVPDREEADEDKESEETNWLQIDTYAKRCSLTPRMVVNDDLDVFARRLMALQISHDLTLNMLALNLLTGNVTLPDGYALYDTTNHSNEVASGSGGAPSVTQASLMRKTLRAQRDVGGRNRIRVPMKIALVPAELETAAEQTFLAFSQLGYTADSSINTFRGKVRISVEPNLSDSSATKWYGFAEPSSMPAIVVAFLRGYEGGQRRSWYDQATEVRYTEVKGNFAAAVADYRPTIRNFGA